jgi:hypothetical protein
MEGSRAEGIQTAEQASTPGGGGRRFALYWVAAFAALVGTVVLAVIVLGPDSTASVGTTEATGEGQQTAFALFDEFHATLIVTPGATGANTLDLILATHDGSGAPDVSEVTVTAALPSAGVEPRAYPAEPVAGSPGTYRVDLPLSQPGDWELTLSVVPAGSEPVAETAIVPIGAR